MENWMPVLVVVGIVLLWFVKSFNVIKEWERGAVLRGAVEPPPALAEAAMKSTVTKMVPLESTTPMPTKL